MTRYIVVCLPREIHPKQTPVMKHMNEDISERIMYDIKKGYH